MSDTIKIIYKGENGEEVSQEVPYVVDGESIRFEMPVSGTLLGVELDGYRELRFGNGYSRGGVDAADVEWPSIQFFEPEGIIIFKENDYEDEDDDDITQWSDDLLDEKIAEWRMFVDGDREELETSEKYLAEFLAERERRNKGK